MRRRLDGRSPERGSAAVEFALVMPLVFVVTLGLVQIGLLARDRALVDAAARAGARVP
jgi:Flp pilus assembly protein TadG